MRAASNNHYQRSMPFKDTPIHSTKLSEDDTGYDSSPNKDDAKARISSRAGLSSSSSSSNHQFDRIMNLVKSLPSPTDISSIHQTSDLALSVAQRIVQFSKLPTTANNSPTRKLNRTRIQPLPDSTSDSADSFALSNHLVLVSSHPKEHSPFPGSLEYIHDDRFDSTTTVDHVKNDVIAIELMEQPLHQPVELPLARKQTAWPWIGRFGESIRLLPANILAVVFISLLGGLLFSALLVFVLA